jgi:hypothetical protein
MRRTLLALCAVGSAAYATTLLALDLNALTTQADVVVRGRVVRVAARWTKDHARIVTDTELAVTETWKGAPTRHLTVMQPGGEVGDLGQLVEGVAKFKVGEEVVLFLEARGDRFTVAGMAQGRFLIESPTNGQPSIARQDQCDDLYLLSQRTRQAVSPAPLALTVEALKQQVVVLAPSAPPPATRVVP